MPKPANIFDKIRRKRHLAASKKSRSRSDVDEFDRYLSTPPEAVDNPIKWWYERQDVYPRLSRMALDYLAIPGTLCIIKTYKQQLMYTLSRIATSVSVERVFSQGRILLSHVRNRLSAESTRALLCLGEWSKMGLVDDKDILAITQAPEVDGAETLDQIR